MSQAFHKGEYMQLGNQWIPMNKGRFDYDTNLA